MNLLPASYKELDGRDRTVAHIAVIARCDTIGGGARALVLARRCPSLMPIVSDVYGASTGYRSKEHEGWKCPECGRAHLGQDAAYKCCNEKES